MRALYMRYTFFSHDPLYIISVLATRLQLLRLLRAAFESS